MGSLKGFGNAMIGLLIVLVGLMVTLNLLKKVPVVGKAASAAESLATEGHL